jgi:hypothetical protein
MTLASYTMSCDVTQNLLSDLGIEAFDGIAQHHSRHLVGVALEERNQTRLVALAHLAQHPADSLSDQIMLVAKEGWASRNVSLWSPARMKVSVLTTAIRRSQTDLDCAKCRRGSRGRSRRCAPTIAGADASTRSQLFTCTVFSRYSW